MNGLFLLLTIFVCNFAAPSGVKYESSESQYHNQRPAAPFRSKNESAGREYRYYNEKNALTAAARDAKYVSSQKSICCSLGPGHCPEVSFLCSGFLCGNCQSIFISSHKDVSWCIWQIAECCENNSRHLDCLHIMLQKPSIKKTLKPNPQFFENLLENFGNWIWPVIFREDCKEYFGCNKTEIKLLGREEVFSRVYPMLYSFVSPGMPVASEQEFVDEPIKEHSIIPRKAPSRCPWECFRLEAPVLQVVSTCLNQRKPAVENAPSCVMPNLKAHLGPKICIACMDNPVDTTFVPCGHQCCCFACGRQLVECPVCRVQIRYRWKDAHIYQVASE